jgi:hypothetical protein
MYPAFSYLTKERNDPLFSNAILNDPAVYFSYIVGSIFKANKNEQKGPLNSFERVKQTSIKLFEGWSPILERSDLSHSKKTNHYTVGSFY